ncbi:MAG: Nitrogen permease regulator 2 [Geoglossum simile]|nr:MAG: Nitrogen permease regulator 2 [Geoglossum simile]
MIKSIFYCQFLARQGPAVLHQVPAGSITPQSGHPPPLIPFPTLTPLLIPRHEFCNRLLTTTTTSKPSYRVLSHPVRIYDPQKYERNDFIFNFAIVLEEEADMASYKAGVVKLAGVFRQLEEEGSVLSKDGGEDGGGKRVLAMMEQILEDLNNYCECMIPIDESNTINIKLFPKYPPPPPVKSFHVPISTVQLEALMDVNWDLTMQKATAPESSPSSKPPLLTPTKIVPYINGINSTRRVAELADADYNLVKKCIEHLLYYGCLIMVDVFQFNAIYACTAEISMLVTDKDMQDECAAYIASTPPRTASDDQIPATLIISLYASLRQGQALKLWCIERAHFLDGIDVRRFISFGVIKGFLYRVHKYAIKTYDSSPPAMDINAAAVAAKGAGPSAIPGEGGDEDKGRAEQLPLMAKYLDGTHCLDEICTDLGCSEKDVLRKLGSYGDVQIIHK